MQVSAALIAAQQAAREAQARFHATQVSSLAPRPAVAAPQKSEGFSPLALKQIVSEPAQTPQPAGITRPGSLLDIKV